MKTIRKGSKGADVRKAQTILTAVGYDVGKIDGVFGDRTDAAVRLYQIRKGLDVDGEIGPQTWAALTADIPAEMPAPVVAPEAPTAPVASINADGWYSEAARSPVHSARVGGLIQPRGVVLHTTDCMPGSLAGILRRQATEKGQGQGAHFWLGRRPGIDGEQWPSGGLVQTVSIYQNANHAGGPNGEHGRVVLLGAVKPEHPNRAYVGIEVDAGGRLEKVAGRWIHQDSGQVVPDADVHLDAKGRGYHRITPYQFEILGRLFDTLEATLARFPDGTKLDPNGDYKVNGVLWGAMPGVRFVGHVTLDPIRKTDPGPQGIAWLREKYGHLG